jgi:hypothetical protein
MPLQWGTINLHPHEDFFPDNFHGIATKEEVINGLLMVAKAASHLHIQTKFSESIFCSQSSMAGQPEGEDGSRPSKIMVHGHLPSNTRVVHPQQFVNHSSDHFTFHMFPSLDLQQCISLL